MFFRVGIGGIARLTQRLDRQFSTEYGFMGTSLEMPTLARSHRRALILFQMRSRSLSSGQQE